MRNFNISKQAPKAQKTGKKVNPGSPVSPFRAERCPVKTMQVLNNHIKNREHV